VASVSDIKHGLKRVSGDYKEIMLSWEEGNGIGLENEKNNTYQQ
jgi:hypothetical protein